MSVILRKFGRYFLLDQIAQGGMAEIYRARPAKLDGPNRILVIKKIQNEFGQNNEFVQMFYSEIKVTMGFNHQNIVQVYDYGEEASQPFIAMEFVDGKNLRQLTHKFSELKKTFPVDLAIYIAEQMAAGLGYAHQFKDKITGDPLNVVHRDISPQNIIISYEGGVKIIDFGIAKATVNSELTRAGVIKGKPSYLSPEQINSEILDGRSDIFALGSVLWELLVGKKLFSGENDLAILKQIESVNTFVKPPSKFNPDIPKELDYIVLRCLAKNREKRYHSATELSRALHKLLYSYNPDFVPSDLAYQTKSLFKDEIVEDRKRLQNLNERVEQLLRLDQQSQQATPPPLEKTTSSRSISKQVIPQSTTPAPTSQTEGKNSQPQIIPAAQMDSFTQKNVLKKLSEHQIEAPIELQKILPPPNTPEIKANENSPHSPTKENKPVLKIPKAKKLSQNLLKTFTKAALFILGTLSTLTYFKDTTQNIPLLGSWIQEAHHEAIVLSKKLHSTNRMPSSNSGSNPPSVQNSTPQTPQPGHVYLKLFLSPIDTSLRVAINDQVIPFYFSDEDSSKFNSSLPQVPLDRPFEILVDGPGYRPLRKQMVISTRQASGQQEFRLDLSVELLRFGYLSLRSTPSAEAKIIVQGKTWLKKRTPFEMEKLPIGSHTLILSNQILGMEKIIDFNIEDSNNGQTPTATQLDVRLDLRAPAQQK